MHEFHWGLPVILYLFLAGLGAGAVTVSGSVLLRKGGFGASRFAIARYGALIGPLPVIIGTSLLIFELGQPFRALNLFYVLNLSPMSVGTWLLSGFMGLSVLYALTFVPPSAGGGDRLAPLRRGLAWICVPLGLSVAVYTGVLLGAMPSRPFWNSPILAGLFMVSALSSGVAIVALVGFIFHRNSTDHDVRADFENSNYLLISTDAILLATELVILFLFLMFAHLTIGDVRYAVSTILPGGAMASLFWGGVVLVGLLLPFLVELYQIVPRLVYGGKFKTSPAIEIMVPVAILIGGFALRYVVVIAGQITAPTTF